MKCSICHKKIQSICMDNFKYVAPGFFVCNEDYDKVVIENAFQEEDNEKTVTKEDNEKIFLERYSSIINEYKEKIIHISIKELFSPFTIQPSNTSEYFGLDQSLIDNSFQFNKNYQYFVPTVSFHFEKESEKIDFAEIISELPKEMTIISVEEGSTLLTLALLFNDDNESNLEDKYKRIIGKFKKKIEQHVQIVGNIIDEPVLKIPKEDEMVKFYEKEYNIFRVIHVLHKDDLKLIKENVKKKLSKEKDKNMQLFFKYFNKYKKAEKKVIHDIIAIY